MTRRPLPKWRRGVRERIYDHVYSSPGGEVGGVLVGEIPKTGPVRITAAIPALRAEGERASVTFTHDAWSDVHAIMERKHKGKRIVGWYHSHPGFGIFLSEHDLFIQRNFFSDPAQVAYVVDPHASTEGLFAWVDGDIEQVMSAKTPRRPANRPLPGKAGNATRGSSRRGPVVAGAIAMVAAGALVWLLAFNGNDDTATSPGQAVTVTQTVTVPRTATPPPAPASGETSGATKTEARPPVENGKFGSKSVPSAKKPPVGSASSGPAPAAGSAQQPPPATGGR